MKKTLKFIVILASVLAGVVLVVILLTPWMDRWGATKAEIQSVLPGDELVTNPVSFVNHAISINASPEEIYPWLLQLGAGKAGYYSYEILEGMMNCPIKNADEIHPEWQGLQVGDEVKMCPGEFAPPPYIVAQLHPNQAVVLGHLENEEWVDLWQFVLVPQSDGSTRLILRTRTMMAGGFWDIIHPGVFIMERGMLFGIKARAEATDLSKVAFYTPTPEIFNPVRPSPTPDALSMPEPTPTAEIFIALNPSPTPSSSDLPLTCQITDLNVLIDRVNGFCFAYPLRFSEGEQPGFPGVPGVVGLEPGRALEPVRATLIVMIEPSDPVKPLDQRVDAFLTTFTSVAPADLKRETVTVGGEPGILVDGIPVQLNWRIVFVAHEGVLYRLMYWPADTLAVQADLDELYQTTLNSFAFIKVK